MLRTFLIPDGSDYVDQEGELVYSVSPSSGVVSALNVSTGGAVWTTTVPAGGRGLVVLDSRIYLGDPVGKRLISLNAADGLDQRDGPIACGPWDLTAASGSLYTTCLDTPRYLCGHSLLAGNALRNREISGTTGGLPDEDSRMRVKHFRCLPFRESIACRESPRTGH
jgi:hypothetical protein